MRMCDINLDLNIRKEFLYLLDLYMWIYFEKFIKVSVEMLIIL